MAADCSLSAQHHRTVNSEADLPQTASQTHNESQENSDALSPLSLSLQTGPDPISPASSTSTTSYMDRREVSLMLGPPSPFQPFDAHSVHVRALTADSDGVLDVYEDELTCSSCADDRAFR